LRHADTLTIGLVEDELPLARQRRTGPRLRDVPPIVTVGQAFDPATIGAGANPPCPGPCPGANDAWGAGAGASEPIAPAIWPMIALGSAPKNDI
jgi:hypothetical protein